MAKPECVEAGRPDDPCQGDVEYRMAFYPNATNWPRCTKHWHRRLDLQAEIDRKYGGDLPPADFDPAYAGERWSEDY